MDIGVIEAPTVRQLFTERIAGLIINNTLKPGDRLPSERELAQEAHISRSAVHLGMSDLERMGFVRTDGRHGTFVCDFARTGNIETLNLLIHFNGAEFGQDKIRDLLDMRMAIEGKAFELLCQKLTEDDLQVLQNDYEKAEQETDPDSLSSAFFDFHHDVCVCSGNFILPLIFNTFRDITLVYWQEALKKLGRNRCLDLLKRMLKTIEKKDAKACRNYLQKEFDLFLQEDPI